MPKLFKTGARLNVTCWIVRHGTGLIVVRHDTRHPGFFAICVDGMVFHVPIDALVRLSLYSGPQLAIVRVGARLLDSWNFLGGGGCGGLPKEFLKNLVYPIKTIITLSHRWWRGPRSSETRGRTSAACRPPPPQLRLR